jgi:hypothetical protein
MAYRCFVELNESASLFGDSELMRSEFFRKTVTGSGEDPARRSSPAEARNSIRQWGRAQIFFRFQVDDHERVSVPADTSRRRVSMTLRHMGREFIEF